MSTITTFNDFALSKKTLEAITRKGFTTPSDVQREVIPSIMEGNHDIIAIAQTGTGKTAAFGLPVIDLLKSTGKRPQALVLTPTRELALQVTKEMKSYTSHQTRITTIYGGAPIANQIKELKSGVDIVVGTPGRVKDLINRNVLELSSISHLVLDEADEMLNMGFIEDIDAILAETPEEKRIYLFSATMPEPIQELSKRYMHNQKTIKIKKNQKLHTEYIDQFFYRVEQRHKTSALNHIIDSNRAFYGIVFCKTKAEVDQLTRELKKQRYAADCIHGDVSQRRREKILQQFRNQRINILVATDVAARGIDINNLSHVVNHSLPQSFETYVHRIGRTGRAGNKGSAISLLTSGEMRKLSALEKSTGCKLRREQLPVSS